MEDWQIIELFYERSEAAISEAADKYGKYCHYIANNILHNEQDNEECVNDTYLKAWNTIPPQRPEKLAAFLGKITRNLALDKYRYYHREKRGCSQTVLVLEELKECLPYKDTTEQIINNKLLSEVLNTFLADLPTEKRKIFVRRYWYLSSISEIAKDYALSESNVKIILHRIRNKLKKYLEKEGIVL